MKTKKNWFGISLKPPKNFIRTLVIAIAVVMVWRGMWNFLDIYLFPGNEILSNIVSIVVGIALLYLPDNNIDELT